MVDVGGQWYFDPSDTELLIMCCLLIFISKAKTGQIHKLSCSGKRGSEEEDFILQREIAGDGSVADGASGTENQICPVTDVLLDHIGVSVFDCDTKAAFCRYDPGSSPQREAQIQRQDAQKAQADSL